MAERHGITGLVIFITLVLGCFAFALVLLRLEDRQEGNHGPKIGVVEIEGPIVAAKEGIRQLRKFRKDDEIRAIVVRVNSPGGMVGPAQELYREVMRVREEKPVVASLASVAASGGYYIAAAAQKIIASSGTLTGSIGVISQMTDMHELLELARVKVNVFKTGRYKDVGSPLRPMSEEDREFIEQMLKQIHRQFVRDVARGRKLKEKDLLPIADGRVLTGEEAKKLKLVDNIGNLSDALEVAARLAQAEGDPSPVYERRESFVFELIRGAASALGRELRSWAGGGRRTYQVRAPNLN